MTIINPSSAGALEFIGKMTYTNQANVTINFDENLYDVIQIEMLTHQNLTNNESLWAQIICDNTVADSGYVNSGYIFPDAGQAIAQLTGTTGIALVPNTNNYRASNTGFISASVKIYNLRATEKRFLSQSRYLATALGNFNNSLFGGGSNGFSTDAVNGIRIIAGGGNITGEVNVYGLKGN